MEAAAMAVAAMEAAARVVEERGAAVLAAVREVAARVVVMGAVVMAAEDWVVDLVVNWVVEERVMVEAARAA
jgi:hypothetical protein